jgi:hypothetical protein
MERTVTELRRLQAGLTGTLRSLDWDAVLLIAGFVLATVVCAAPATVSPVQWLSRLVASRSFSAYRHSIAGAAVKRPKYQRHLAALEADSSGTVDVANFGDSRELPVQNRTFAIWVAPRTELQNACMGAVDPVLKLEQLLGLPPGPAPDYVVKEIEVAKDGLFRPCLGAVNDGPPPTCTFDLPSELPADADPKTLRDAYDQMRFVTNQMWQSYRVDFYRNPPSEKDYPFTGYPFTGMGWTYDWATSSRDHYGVSEFVIKGDAVIKVVNQKTPGDFCAKTE